MTPQEVANITLRCKRWVREKDHKTFLLGFRFSLKGSREVWINRKMGVVVKFSGRDWNQMQYEIVVMKKWGGKTYRVCGKKVRFPRLLFHDPGKAWGAFEWINGKARVMTKEARSMVKARFRVRDLHSRWSSNVLYVERTQTYYIVDGGMGD